MRKEFLPFHLPDTGEEEIRSVSETLRLGWLTTGPKVVEFERNFESYVGAGRAVAVNSGTAALHLALEAVGIKEDDEVLVPAMTFAATAEVVMYFKARPVLVDCRPDTLNLDPSAAEGAVTNKTKAIIPVHFAGYPCEMEQIMDIAERHRLFVIEDAAHAFPAAYRGKMIGTIGDITCFSFYATKSITTGEGGMACTENTEWADRMRIMSLHGISKDAWKRYTAEGSWYYEIIAPGFKYNLTDIAAAVGLVQLRKAESMWQRRKDIAEAYTGEFKRVPELQVPHSDGENRHSWHLYVLRLNLDMLTIDRSGFIDELKKRKIGASVHFIPLHIHPFYRDRFGYTPECFPVAYGEYQREISLPIYSRMSDEDVRDVVGAVIEIVSDFRR